MNTFSIARILRPNIKNLKPYSCARNEFSGDASVFLDANENPFDAADDNAKLNRYPDPLQNKLKAAISKIKKINAENIFLGNGSDEPIDLLIRAFCEPRADAILTFNPTYGMYKVAADINNVKAIEQRLSGEFQVNFSELKKQFKNKNLKLIFICSPNNPSGNLIQTEAIKKILNNFNGIVVLDEAYIDFCKNNSFLPALNQYENLVILQTFSKAWGMAGARLGMAFAAPEIVRMLNKIKYPYNINVLSQKTIIQVLHSEKKKNIAVKKILSQREIMRKKLSRLKIVEKVFSSDANFLLIKFHESEKIFEYLKKKGIIVRNKSAEIKNCLRITVGTAEENGRLLTQLAAY